MTDLHNSLQDRIDQVKERVLPSYIIGKVVTLRGRSTLRGKCPFHGSKSESLSVEDGKRRWKCFGCGIGGDVIGFVREWDGLDFMAALKRLEDEGGLSGAGPASHRSKAPVKTRHADVDRVDSIVMGRHIWKTAQRDDDRIRRYLVGRGVPSEVLTEERLRDLMFHPAAPLTPWPVDGDPQNMPHAPAMVALIRVPDPVRPVSEWRALGVHVTWLNAKGTGKLVRKRRNGDPYPDRKMLGHVTGGCVVLGAYHADVALAVGEGLETVLSGIALTDAAACGLAALSLDNLQGYPLLLKGNIWPLWSIKPALDRPSLRFAHRGRVVGLLDADMKPLLGAIDRRTKRPRGVPVQRHRGYRPEFATITSHERTQICADLFSQQWRAAGSHLVSTLRPHMGQDFNDLARSKGVRA